MNRFRGRMNGLALALFATCLGCGVPPADGGRTAATVSLGNLATDSAFGAAVDRLSEPGGYFDTDNLISNERSYLHVAGELRELRPGGAYVGVGPDQNFSYIATARPALAVIVDIRRDNLLQHLLFKALFDASPTRVAYLSLLTGRPAPGDPDAWRGRDVEALVEWVDGGPPAVDAARRAARAAVDSRVGGYGVRLSEADRATIRRFHTAFIEAGLDLRFRSHGRTPRPYYPTLRQLLLETDRDGRPSSYLADEDGYRFVRALQRRNLVLPVVGDLAGEHTLSEVGRLLEERGLAVSAVYASNVEFYLAREGTLDRFVENLRALPRRPGALLVRSYFGGVYGRRHPEAVPGYASVQLTQRIEDLLRGWDAGEIRGYRDLVATGVAPPLPGARAARATRGGRRLLNE